MAFAITRFSRKQTSSKPDGQNVEASPLSSAQNAEDIDDIPLDHTSQDHILQEQGLLHVGDRVYTTNNSPISGISSNSKISSRQKKITKPKNAHKRKKPTTRHRLR